ncbi:family 43 glycosylhydrolase [Allosaccharopolyspora coralli]|uniref:Family 43 glycosylhydrolase n=1 Tax=Allosaccharopolyspora coralli TaxID=2665642 RepID=A0A5Q3QCS9_9PSEU|nr:family 43 glycosylhydrolase [Allosaccharopolyspora coralli]
MGTNATYFNDASTFGADPFVLWDEASGQYVAYSTDGADAGYRFAIYRSPDLITWQKVPGGALDVDDGSQWAHDWFWAPEVYHNPDTGLYYLFYSARMNEGVAEHFRYPDFEEACKIGVAVSDTPYGPFRNITTEPLDYRPYDPDYHDVNLIMDDTQKKPPETLEEGRTAPKGTYLPFIDPNVFFDGDRIFLYFSRNAYRNWVWDHDLSKYIEESNVYAVELTTDWWNDPAGGTAPTVHPDYVNANLGPDDPPGTRKDGYTPILDYGSDKQEWENAHVDDYAETGGEKKDRRWEEGTTTVKAHRADGSRIYYLTYSANNFQNRHYGVGYATAQSPLGPWRKAPENPVLSQDEQQSMFSTGHGSVIASPDGAELYYVHHGRPSTSDHRRIYTARMRLDDGGLSVDQSTADRPIPSGVAPYALETTTDVVRVDQGATRIGWTVRSARGAGHALTHPLNRVTTSVEPPDAVTLENQPDGAIVRDLHGDLAALTMRYERARADGEFFGVDNHRPEGRESVGATVPVVRCAQTITGRHDGPLEITDGATCLRGAEVNGPVRVRAGASVLAIDSTITGTVSSQGPGGVWVSGGSVGSVDTDGAGLVRLERTAVHGSVRLANGTQAVAVDDSTVGGDVRLVANTGGRPILVAGNEIDGALRCDGNEPRPTDDDRPNQVVGGSHGQCGGLHAG